MQSVFVIITLILAALTGVSAKSIAINYDGTIAYLATEDEIRMHRWNGTHYDSLFAFSPGLDGIHPTTKIQIATGEEGEWVAATIGGGPLEIYKCLPHGCRRNFYFPSSLCSGSGGHISMDAAEEQLLLVCSEEGFVFVFARQDEMWRVVYLNEDPLAKDARGYLHPSGNLLLFVGAQNITIQKRTRQLWHEAYDVFTTASNVGCDTRAMAPVAGIPGWVFACGD